ncbi:MAG: general secretion pathway protein GspK [Alphaproteobacteria bacterium]|nr:general secretion pathway protein GspK [Alphaproteobacteria bacterium]MBV9062634.1 general secretion pathway protein GspK [Alphaproteobacteria bacterium]
MTVRSDKGYAMLAAILGIAAFSFVSFEVIAENRGIISEVQAENERAKLAAACNAGMGLAIAGLAAKDKKQQWLIDGTKRSLMFDDVALTITVEDERGKVPLTGINEDQVRGLFAAAGVSGPRLSTLVDSYEDWLDPDSERRVNGAEVPQYASAGYKPRNGGFHTVGELRMLNGMDDDLYARVSPAITVFFGETGGFSEGTSQILALEALSEVGPNSSDVRRRMQELSGQRPADDVRNPPFLIGRTLTVRVEAKRAGAALTRAGIIELTGNPIDPVWMRYLD